MKKVVSLTLCLLGAGMLFFSSCSSDSSNPTPQNPTINFLGGNGYVSTDVTVAAGSALKFGITSASNTSSGAKLTNFKITRVFNNTPMVVLDSTINVTYYNVDISTAASQSAGQEKFIFRITDKDGKYAEISVTVTTTPSAGPINSWTQRILGAQSNITGSSFASVNGNVYTLADAKANAALIDWLYFYGATNLATLACPADPDAQTVFNNATNGIQTWTVKNLTLFKKVTDQIVWTDITDDSIIVEQTASGVDQTKIPNLAQGDILAFISQSGKKGMIRVVAITTGSDGTMTIDVKVQQ